ncbi:hypothetical protein GUITHDRAFT_150639 [Guillardia theta CCMP2712]|uniref:Uncharacterized protein n=1 Tax=Guillardia theta (strain CCMP2712) TaxID=905079 RepID=L1JXA9_GUITC|nr:hypothetical protein GUITHDRAFT_150639 [Guillardia theta CCMP2712]EKX52733.1 hypothetical protein GUITHDRAFT_150639 [Guillardia theta CCMP2712]|eukprot:XP_005839713.1 hypothetical protein GUITHDRAFT_150639 [Guillardia theta CCMP2712]
MSYKRITGNYSELPLFSSAWKCQMEHAEIILNVRRYVLSVYADGSDHNEMIKNNVNTHERKLDKSNYPSVFLS